MAQLDKNESRMPRADLVAAFAAIPGVARTQEHGDGLWMAAPELDVEAMAREMKVLGYRLITVTGRARADGETTLIYHYHRVAATHRFGCSRR